MASPSRTVRVKFDGDAKGLSAAAKNGERELDKFGKNVDKSFGKSGDKASKSFGASVKKWFTGEGDGLFEEVGKSGGTVFGSGLLGALKTPVLGPAILAVLAGAVAVAAPAAGAIAAGGLVAGFGAGLAGLGLVFAAKSQPVKDAWQKTLSAMGADMSKLSKPFETTLVSIAGFAQRTFDKFKPSLEAVFKELAPVVTKFADQIGRGLEQLQPAIRPISEAFAAVLDSLGPAMQGAIGNVSNGFIKLAESVKKNPDGLADMVSGVGDLTQELLGLVTSLNNAYAGIKNIATQVPVLSGALTTNDKAVQAQGKHWSNMIPIIGSWLGILGVGRTEVDKTTASVGLTGNALGLFTQGLNQSQVAAMLAGTSTQGLAQQVEAAGGQAAYAQQQLEGYIGSMFRLQNLSLGLSGAQINLQSAIDNATASVKENGRTLDINTEKGRANRTALDSVANSANGQTEAMLRSGKGVRAAANAADVSRKNFVDLAVKMGMGKAQADALAKSLIAVPKKTQTDFKADIRDLEGKIKTAKQKLADKSLTATKRAQLQAEIAQLLSAKKKAQDAINSLTGKTVNVTLNTYKNMIETTTHKDVGVRAPGRALGGPVFAGRTYLVGENGPETLTMGSSSGRITPNHELGGPTIIETHIEIGGEVVRVVRQEIKQDNKNLKRRVTAGVK